MFKDLVIANRSVRGFDPAQKVKKEELIEMADCARLSASSANIQPLKYYIACDDESVGILRNNVKYGKMHPEWGLPLPGTEAPAFICICHDLSVSPNEAAFLKDVGIAAQSITLCAAEMGYGACMIGNYVPEKVEKELGLSENLKVKLIIAVGKSVENISIVEIDKDGDTVYYRDEEGKHYVPKRKLEDVIIC